MRLGPTHPLATLLDYVGWTAVAVPLAAFAGAVTFGVKAGTAGALLGLVLGAAMGTAFVVAWHWIGGRSPQRPDSTHPTAPVQSEHPRSTKPPTASEGASRPGQPLSVPPPRGSQEVVHGAAALDSSLMEPEPNVEARTTREVESAQRPSSPTEAALAIHEAALNDDLDRAFALLRSSWDRRDQMYLDPSTALAGRRVGDFTRRLGGRSVVSGAGKKARTHSGWLHSKNASPLSRTRPHSSEHRGKTVGLPYPRGRGRRG